MAGIDCYMPANGETATVTTNPSVPVDMSLNLLKREMALGGTFSFINSWETLGVCLIHSVILKHLAVCVGHRWFW